MAYSRIAILANAIILGLFESLVIAMNSNSYCLHTYAIIQHENGLEVAIACYEENFRVLHYVSQFCVPIFVRHPN